MAVFAIVFLTKVFRSKRGHYPLCDLRVSRVCRRAAFTLTDYQTVTEGDAVCYQPLLRGLQQTALRDRRSELPVTHRHTFLKKKKMAQMSFVSADKFRFLMNSPYGTLSLSLSLYRSDKVVCPFEAHVAAAGEDS